MGILSNRINVKLVSKKKYCSKWTSKPSYMTQNMFNNNFMAIHKNKATLTRNKPAYVRICILDLSKVLMHEFHYDYIKNKYGNSSRLLFTDTDILMYEIKNEDIYEDFRRDKEMFDFSNYSTKLKYYDDSNKLVIVK